jgi:dTMP kinase
MKGKFIHSRLKNFSPKTKFLGPLSINQAKFQPLGRNSGRLITFEGSEGCGKSTQSRLLYQYLKRKGYNVIYLREPGSTKVGEKIRKILLDAKNDSLTSECEMLLYLAARSQVVDEIISPALSAGKIVICDRFLDSTIAYQGFGLGLDIKIIKDIGHFVTKGITPDLTILLDLAIEKGFKYNELKKDRIEKRSFAYHVRVRNGYLKMARLYPARIKIVKIDADENTVQQRIRKLVDNFLRTDIKSKKLKAKR